MTSSSGSSDNVQSKFVFRSSVLPLQVIYILLVVACLTPWVTSVTALLLGMGMGLIFGNPWSEQTRRLTPKLLQISVIGLGAGMNLAVVGQVGLSGVGYTAIGIILALLTGIVLGKVLRVNLNTSVLVSVGTAICGGSAIAAVAPTIRAKSQEVSVALATVFFLNSAALVIFPPLGHYFQLDEVQFGLWSALAVHDTSSVVGTAFQYGPKALEIATTVKLARALWIIPVSLVIGMVWQRLKIEVTDGAKPKYPWFILGFLAMAALVTWVPDLQSYGQSISAGAKRTLVLTLFLIGSGLSKATLKNIGVKPFIQGILLWLCVGTGTLVAIQMGWIHL